jgi:hypothetical protein
MEDSSRDSVLRMAAFERVRALREIHDHLTAQQLGEGFFVDDQRYQSAARNLQARSNAISLVNQYGVPEVR